MTIEEALVRLDAVFNQKYLNDLQELVFRQAWEGRTYEEIAKTFSYDLDYIKHVGSQLWKLLSKAFREKVTKSNFRSVLRRRMQDTQLTSALSNTTKTSSNGQKLLKLLLTMSEAQALTGLSREFLRDAINLGQLKAKMIGRSWRIKRSDLEEYVSNLF